MNKEELIQLLYQKYFRPTEREREHYIGVEIEMPIVNLKGEAVDFAVVHRLTAAFLERFGFRVTGIDYNGAVYAAVSDENGDVFSYDCSFNNLELSFGRERSLCEIHRRFRVYYDFIQDFFKPLHYTLTGMGINPNRLINRSEPIENGRYKMLFHHLSSFPKYARLPMYFHKYPQFGMFSSASQVQLDVTRDRLPLTIDVFNRLEPIKALLFANSVLLGEHEELLCCRDMLWENSTHGIHPHNVGMYDCEISSVDDLLQYLTTTAAYCVERGGKYLNFPPMVLLDYFNSDELAGEYVENGTAHTMNFTPKPEDIAYLRTFKFEDLTFRGTVEYRSACCQPITDVMTVAAFHVGLAEKLGALDELLKNDTVLYQNGYNAAELRAALVRRELPSFIDADALYTLAAEVLRLCREGLRERGEGEERFLDALDERVRRRSNPARDMLERLENGESIEQLTVAYS